MAIVIVISGKKFHGNGTNRSGIRELEELGWADQY